MVKQYKNKRKRRHLRVRGKIKGTINRPRLSVFRSNKHIFTQIIDDEKGKTLTALSDQSKQFDNLTIKQLGKIEVARLVGRELAKSALAANIKTVVFDRGGYKYHGRVKALAEGAREGGLRF